MGTHPIFESDFDCLTVGKIDRPMRNLLCRLGSGQRRCLAGLFGAGNEDGKGKKVYHVDIGPMVPGRKRSKPIKNDPEEKSAFLFPRWKTKYVDSIDVLDAVGTNVRIGSRFNNIIDIRACRNDDVNLEYATDKARFSYDGLSKGRILEPMIRSPSGQLSSHGWDEILQICGDALIDAGERVAALAGPFTDAETLTVARDLLNILGSESYYTEEYCSTSTDLRSHYLMNMPLTGIEYADCILLVGFNPRLEAPLVNPRIQSTVINNKAKVGIVGLKMNMGYTPQHEFVVEIQRLASVVKQNTIANQKGTDHDPMA